MHVSIVVSVSSGTVTVVGGDMKGPNTDSTSASTWAHTSLVVKHTVKSGLGVATGAGTHVHSYISPIRVAPTSGLLVNLSNPADGRVSLSWQSSYNPDRFTVTQKSPTGAKTTITPSPNDGTARQVYANVTSGTWTFTVCTVTGGAATECSSVNCSRRRQPAAPVADLVK